jgi:23S rRNA (uracil1939-C5)-methyltransferase
MFTSSSIFLPGYLCQLDDDAVLHSKEKVNSAAEDLFTIGISKEHIHTLPCLTDNEAIDYRCSCTFQILSKDSNNGEIELQYAMRSAKNAILLGGDHFPIATPRIQQIMKHVLKELNGRYACSENNKAIKYPLLRSDLSSVSFASSWNNDMDCIATFNYCSPIHANQGTKEELLKEANDFCRDCNITTLILRSKKMKEIAGRLPPYIDDVLHLKPQADGAMKVALGEGDKSSISIFYHKPEDAFQHPNGNTMLQALGWIMTKLHSIERKRSENKKDFRLLEMYCGCGAHTIPIAKCAIFDSIVAVELDQRLVIACQDNCIKNGCSPQANNCKGDKEDVTPVYSFQGDAGEWAAKSLLRRTKGLVASSNTTTCINKASKSYWYGQDFNVLLVDPPRMGLSQEVRSLAINGSFEHMIYVSCGRVALKADLDALKVAFDVVDCTITDLFPRTDSVESLVHLQRR